LLTGALADFGELGIFIIPALFCFILSKLLSASRKHMNPLTTLLISLYILFKLSGCENDIGVYFAIVKFMIIFSVILWFFLDFNKERKPLKIIERS
jgi:predicted branched-subunit amino acid permease